MKTTSDTRYPARRMTIYDPEIREIGFIIKPGERVIIENRAADQKKSMIMILPHRQ